MARGYGYGLVTKEALIAFRSDLDRGIWKETQVIKDPKRRLPDPNGTSILVMLKLLVSYAIDDLIDAMGPEETALLSLDGEWDDLQKDLEFELALKKRRGTPEEKLAATQIEPILFPVGLSHTLYDIPKEITFGKSQITIARSDKALPYMVLLGLEPFIQKIQEKTLELEEASKNQSPAVRIRRYSSICAATLTDTRAILEQMLSREQPGPAKDALEARLVPFQTLLQHISRHKETKEETQPTEEIKSVD
jgi:hypothetical protein